MKYKLAVLILIGLLASGCATTGRVNYHPDMLITEEDLPSVKYRLLGDISVTAQKPSLISKDPTKENVNNLLRSKAAKMGADAVILVRYGSVGIGLNSWGELKGSGRAVKIID